MDDLISRKQAIDAADVYMKRLCRYIGTSDDTMTYAFARGLLVGIKMDIGELPSAQPEISMDQIKIWLDAWEGYVDKDIIARMKYRVIDIPFVQTREETT